MVVKTDPRVNGVDVALSRKGGGEPGATKKGCSVHGEEMPGALIVALAGILGLRRRRR